MAGVVCSVCRACSLTGPLAARKSPPQRVFRSLCTLCGYLTAVCIEGHVLQPALTLPPTGCIAHVVQTTAATRRWPCAKCWWPPGPSTSSCWETPRRQQSRWASSCSVPCGSPRAWAYVHRLQGRLGVEGAIRMGDGCQALHRCIVGPDPRLDALSTCLNAHKASLASVSAGGGGQGRLVAGGSAGRSRG